MLGPNYCSMAFIVVATLNISEVEMNKRIYLLDISVEKGDGVLVYCNSWQNIRIYIQLMEFNALHTVTLPANQWNILKP